MKLVKSDLRFEVAGLEGGLDIWFDAEKGDNASEENAWFVASDIYKWWGIANQTFSDWVNKKHLGICKNKYLFFNQETNNASLKTVINYKSLYVISSCFYSKNKIATAFNEEWDDNFKVCIEKVRMAEVLIDDFKRDDVGYLYYLILYDYIKEQKKLVKYIKVGKTKCLDKRLLAYNFARIEELDFEKIVKVNDLSKQETLLLKKLRKFHLKGECFKYSSKKTIEEFFDNCSRIQ